MMANNKATVKFIADPKLFMMGTILWFTLTFGTIAMSVWVYSDYVPDSSDKEELVVSVMYLFMGLMMTLISFFCLPKWLVIIKFDKSGITYKCGYKKAKKYDYSRYGYVYKASYLHFFHRVNYIVFSQIKLSEYQLTHINSVSTDDKLIKFKLGKNIEILRGILPKKYIAKIDAIQRTLK